MKTCIFAIGYFLLGQKSFAKQIPICIGAMFPLVATNNTDPLHLGAQLTIAFLMGIINSGKYIQTVVFDYEFQPIGNTVSQIFTNTDILLKHSKCNGQKDVTAILGGYQDLDTNFVSILTNEKQITQFVYGSTNPDFSFNDQHPNLVRMLPNDAVQGFIFADILFNHYKYQRIVVIHSTSNYGNTMFSYFESVVIERGVDILATLAINNGQSFDIQHNLAPLKVFDPRIFVLMIEDQETAANIIETGYNIGLFNIETFILGTNTLISSQFVSKFNNPKILNIVGINGLEYKPDTWKVIRPSGYTFYKQFMTYWIYYWNTIRATDSATLKNSKKYLSYSDLSPLTAYVYDAVTLIAYGLSNCNLSKPVTHDILINALQNLPVIEGVSQSLNYSGGVKFLNNYGNGDISLSDGFHLIAYQCETPQELASGNCFHRVGNWTTKTGLTLCGSNYHPWYTNEYLLWGNCTQIQYGTQDNTPTKDRAEPIYLTSPPSLAVLYVFTGGILLFVNIFLAFILFKHRHNKILKLCQLPMLTFMNVCSIFGILRILLSIPAKPIVSYCLARFWIGHLNYIIIIIILVKLYRTRTIVSNKSLKKIKFTSYKTTGIIAGLTSGLLFLMILSTALNRPYIHDNTNVLVTGQAIHDLVCKSPRTGYDYVLYAYEGIILLAVCKLCNDIKDTFDSINEAKAIVICMGIVVVFTTGGFSVVSTLQMNAMTNEIVTSITFFICNAAIFFVYFAPKIWMIMNGADLDVKLRVVYKSKSVVLNAAQMKQEIIEHDVKAKFLKVIPKTAKECQDLIQIFQELIVTINMKGTQSSNHSSNNHSNSINNIVVEYSADTNTNTIRVSPIE
jgi:hypothetical protein